MTLGQNGAITATTKRLSGIEHIPKQAKKTFVDVGYKESPELKPNAIPINVAAKQAIIYDVGSGQALYKKNSEESVPIASLTKLMTAMVILQNHSPDEIVTVPSNLPALQVNDQKINLQAGEQLKLSEMMRALLVYSANDVANSLAIWDSGSINDFTSKMNAYAKTWNLNNSHFTNPTGLDEINNRSSSDDLLALSNILIKNNNFRQIVNTQSVTIYNTAGKPYALSTTNKDLGLSYVYGIKTGFTDLAGQCLILLAQKGGHEIVTVVLNSPDRFQESKNMIDYTFNNYIWK